MFKHFLQKALRYVQMTLNGHIGRIYTVHYFHALARLDLPTFEDMAVQQQLKLPQTSSSIVWQMILAISHTGFKSLTLISQIIVLIRVLREQSDGPFLSVVFFIYWIMSLSVQSPFAGHNCSKPRYFGVDFVVIDYVRL